MEVGDCSIWHCLIFCEEFVNENYENNVVCWVCGATVLGHSTFKCLECSFVQHKSCTQLHDLTGKDIKHDIWSRHHLILREEPESSGKEEVVCVGCGGCGGQVPGLASKCCIPGCTIRLHKSCHQLSHAIQHALHPDHTLFLQMPSLPLSCDLCGKDGAKDITLFYGCRFCDFDMDYKCVSRWENVVDDCDMHEPIPGRKPIQFTCEACGMETKDFACYCSNCRVMTHLWCSQFPRTIKIRLHHHLFYRTYCLRRVRKLEKAFCRLCCKKVNTECGAYYCQVCDYIVHMKCGRKIQDKSPINSEATELDDYERHLVYLIDGLNEEDGSIIAPSKVHHYSHPQHELILKYEDPKSDKRCEACMQFIIFFPFYGCDECNIFLHKRCVELPETIWRKPFCVLPSKLYSQPPYTDELFSCKRCLHYRQGFFYKYESWYGKGQDDIQCFLIPETINHKCHGHLLRIPLINDDGAKEICSGCGIEMDGKHWRIICSDCKFWLCFNCATLPLVARYRYHPHLLNLTYTCKDNLEECYCLICEEKRDSEQWFYSCANCDFTTHIQCVIGSPLKKGSHQHPVIVVKGVQNCPKCHSCKAGICDYLSIECTQCKFNFHIECYHSTL